MRRGHVSSGAKGKAASLSSVLMTVLPVRQRSIISPMYSRRAANWFLLPVVSGLLGTSLAGEVAEPAPLLPVPNAAQMRWHKAEYLMFAHFGMKTFHPSGNHMGSGKEDPNSFNP